MSVLHDKRIPIAKSGVNAIEKDFLEISGVTGTCRAVVEENFIEWANKVCINL